jgi:hypothetical protein
VGCSRNRSPTTGVCLLRICRTFMDRIHDLSTHDFSTLSFPLMVLLANGWRGQRP